LKAETQRRLRRIETLIKGISCSPYMVWAYCDGDTIAIRSAVLVNDVRNGDVVQVGASGFIVPKDATHDSILRAILLQLKTLATHEVEERFTYRGRRVFNPHEPVAKMLRRTPRALAR
jgi:hypothetical protein